MPSSAAPDLVTENPAAFRHRRWRCSAAGGLESRGRRDPFVLCRLRRVAVERARRRGLALQASHHGELGWRSGSWSVRLGQAVVEREDHGLGAVAHA